MAIEVEYEGFGFTFPDGTSDEEVYSFLEENALSMMEGHQEESEPKPERKFIGNPKGNIGIGFEPIYEADAKKRTAELKESNPEMSDEEIQEKVRFDQGIDTAKYSVMAPLMMTPIGQTWLGSAAIGAGVGGTMSLVDSGAEAIKGNKDFLSLDTAKDAGVDALIGGVLGPLVKGIGKAADFVGGSKQARALDELNNIGRRAKVQKDDAVGSHLSDDVVGELRVSGTAKVKDVEEASILARSFDEINENGGKVGTVSLARSVENPTLNRLIQDSSSRWEQASQVVTGKSQSAIRNTAAENLGLRADDLASVRSDALKEVEFSIKNRFDDAKDLFKKDPFISKGDMKTLQQAKTQTNSAISASKSGNNELFAKSIVKAEKSLEKLREVDDVVASALKKELAKVKAGHSMRDSARQADGSDILSNSAPMLGAAVPMLDGFDGANDLTSGVLTAAAIIAGKRGINHMASKSADKQLKKVDKALKGELGALKQRFKDKDKGLPVVNSLLRSFILMKENEESGGM